MGMETNNNPNAKETTMKKNANCPGCQNKAIMTKVLVPHRSAWECPKCGRLNSDADLRRRQQQIDAAK